MNGGTARGFSPSSKRSSSAIAITADGDLLLVVNPDSDSVSLVELQPTPSVQEIAVGVDPRTVTVDDAGRRAYVTNRGSHSVSVVDLVAGEVVTEIEVGARPYGVIVSPDGSRLYVAEQGADRISIIDTSSYQLLQALPTADLPDGLTISPNGATLYVTHLYLNKVSVIGTQQPNVYLPFIQFTGATGQALGFGVRESVAGNPSRQISLFPNSNLLQSLVLSADGKTAYVPHTRSNSANRALTLDSTVFPTVSLIDLDHEQHLLGEQLELAALDPPAVGLPFDAALHPKQNELWVANAASNDVTVIDLDTRKRIAHIEVGDNPRGIAIAPDGSKAYVNNTLAGTVSVINTSKYEVTSIITSTTIPLDPTLLLGKKLFNSSNDPRMGPRPMDELQYVPLRRRA